MVKTDKPSQQHIAVWGVHDGIAFHSADFRANVFQAPVGRDFQATPKNGEYFYQPVEFEFLEDFFHEK
jgi:hypothetical protein